MKKYVNAFIILIFSIILLLIAYLVGARVGYDQGCSDTLIGSKHKLEVKR